MNSKIKTVLIHVSLFLMTLLTATLAGTQWISGKVPFFTEFTMDDFVDGLSYSLPFLFILGVHEFGHYFMAQRHKVKVTLPYFIPIYFGPFLNIGTMGALIRIKERISSRLKYFDIGIAGPLAGFVAALFVLFYGFTNLPSPDYVYEIHPEYEAYGENYADSVYNSDSTGTIYMGTNLLMQFFEKTVADPEKVPNKYEMIHYPWIFAGFLSLFFTALNLLPIGQLDGGHILYGLVGARRQGLISSVLFIGMLFYSGLGLIPSNQPMQSFLTSSIVYIGFLFICLHKFTPKWQDKLMIAVGIYTTQFLTTYLYPEATGYSGWLLFMLLIGRFLGVRHPQAEIDDELSTDRKILGWLALIIFIICFSPSPLVIE